MSVNSLAHGVESHFSHPLKKVLLSNTVLIETLKFGWHQKSIGFKVVSNTNETLWVRISIHKTAAEADLRIGRLRSANTLQSIQKPDYKAALVTQKGGQVWSTVYMDYIDQPVISEQTYIEGSSHVLDAEYFVALKSQLSLLGRHVSPYIAFRQDLIDRRIKERCPQELNTQITDWNTVHGDLHWANLTKSGTILDWESWGTGPAGIDIAFLYAFSLRNSKVSKTISDVFSDLFSTPQFQLCLLFVCSELIRMTEIYDDHLNLHKDLLSLERRIYQKVLN